MTLAEKAYLVAKTAHAAVGQKRKYTGEDYIHHPVEVASILRKAGYNSEEVQAAALLHDLVEDTELTLDFIVEEFGTTVASLVEGLTDVSKAEDGNRATRKAIDREHIAKQSSMCKTIKLADIISNSKSILEHDWEFARVYLKEKMALLRVLEDGDVRLWEEAYEIVQNGLEQLGD